MSTRGQCRRTAAGPMGGMRAHLPSGPATNEPEGRVEEGASGRRRQRSIISWGRIKVVQGKKRPHVFLPSTKRSLEFCNNGIWSHSSSLGSLDSCAQDEKCAKTAEAQLLGHDAQIDLMESNWPGAKTTAFVLCWPATNDGTVITYGRAAHLTLILPYLVRALHCAAPPVACD